MNLRTVENEAISSVVTRAAVALAITRFPDYENTALRSTLIGDVLDDLHMGKVLRKGVVIDPAKLDANAVQKIVADRMVAETAKRLYMMLSQCAKDLIYKHPEFRDSSKREDLIHELLMLQLKKSANGGKMVEVREPLIKTIVDRGMISVERYQKRDRKVKGSYKEERLLRLSTLDSSQDCYPQDYYPQVCSKDQREHRIVRWFNEEIERRVSGARTVKRRLPDNHVIKYYELALLGKLEQNIIRETDWAKDKAARTRKRIVAIIEGTKTATCEKFNISESELQDILYRNRHLVALFKSRQLTWIMIGVYRGIEDFIFIESTSGLGTGDSVIRSVNPSSIQKISVFIAACIAILLGLFLSKDCDDTRSTSLRLKVAIYLRKPNRAASADQQNRKQCSERKEEGLVSPADIHPKWHPLDVDIHTIDEVDHGCWHDKDRVNQSTYLVGTTPECNGLVGWNPDTSKRLTQAWTNSKFEHWRIEKGDWSRNDVQLVIKVRHSEYELADVALRNHLRLVIFRYDAFEEDYVKNVRKLSGRLTGRDTIIQKIQSEHWPVFVFVCDQLHADTITVPRQTEEVRNRFDRNYATMPSRRIQGRPLPLGLPPILSFWIDPIRLRHDELRQLNDRGVSAVFSLRGYLDGRVSLYIYRDKKLVKGLLFNEVVFRVEEEPLSQYSLWWNLKDRRNRQVEAGTYEFRLKYRGRYKTDRSILYLNIEAEPQCTFEDLVPNSQDCPTDSTFDRNEHDPRLVH